MCTGINPREVSCMGGRRRQHPLRSSQAELCVHTVSVAAFIDMVAMVLGSFVTAVQ